MSAVQLRKIELLCSNMIMSLPSPGSELAYKMPLNDWELEASIHFLSRIRDAAAKRAAQDEEAEKRV
jgi:hypothetical protein